MRKAKSYVLARSKSYEKRLIQNFKKHKYVSIGVAIILILLLATALILPSFEESSVVSRDGLKSYFEEHLSGYSRLVEENTRALTLDKTDSFQSRILNMSLAFYGC